MESEATDGVDGGLTEDNAVERGQRDGEEAEVFLRTGCQTMPSTMSRPAQFGADRVILFSKEEEDGIGFVVGVKAAGLEQGVDERWSDAALGPEVMLDAKELTGIGHRKLELGPWPGWRECGRDRAWKMPIEPIDCLVEVKIV